MIQNTSTVLNTLTYKSLNYSQENIWFDNSENSFNSELLARNNSPIICSTYTLGDEMEIDTYNAGDCNSTQEESVCPNSNAETYIMDWSEFVPNYDGIVD